MSSVLKALTLSLTISIMGCSLIDDDEKNEIKKRKFRATGYWLMTSVKESESASLTFPDDSDSYMLAISEAYLQIYALDGAQDNFIGRNQPYRVENKNRMFISSIGDNSVDVTVRFDVTSRDTMKVWDVRVNSSELIFSEAEFKRITYEKSLEYYRDFFASNRADGDFPDAGSSNKNGEVVKPFASVSDLEGFWVFDGVSDDNKLFDRGEVLTSEDVRVPDEDIIFHFRNGKLIQYSSNGATSPDYAPFDIVGKAIVVREQSIDGNQYREQRINVQTFSGTSDLMKTDQVSTYGMSVDGEWYARISKDEAAERLRDNSVYRQHFTVAPIASKQQLEGFWLLDLYQYKNKTYHLLQSTSDGKSIENGQLIFHFEDGKVMQYFNDDHNFDRYKDYDVTGSYLDIKDVSNGRVKITSFSEKTGDLMLERFVTPHWVEGEVYRKLSESEANNLLQSNSLYKNR